MVFTLYVPADLVKYCSMQIIMGAWSCGHGFSVTHHRLESCAYPGIVTFILELFSREHSCEREKQLSISLTYTCFKPAGMAMCLRSKVMKRPVIGYVIRQLLGPQIQLALPPTPLPLHSARPPAHASTLAHLVNTRKYALITGLFFVTLGFTL